MIVVTCPVCGIKGDETDFHYGGQAHVRRPATTDPVNITDEEQRDYLFIRHNPKGLHFERWRCDRGCGKWFHAARDTVTLDFKAFYGHVMSHWKEAGELVIGATGAGALDFEIPAGLDFTEKVIPPDDPAMKAEMLLLAPSMLVPSLEHQGLKVWDTLAIGEYLHEIKPKAGLLPAEIGARAHCRAICGEMHSGFSSLRSALPMNIKAHFPKYKVWARAQGDIDRITEIWRDCLETHGGPYLFGERTMADAMYAPVVTRFLTYDVPLDPICKAYCETILALPELQAWIADAHRDPEEMEELEAEF